MGLGLPLYGVADHEMVYIPSYVTYALILRLDLLSNHLI